MADRREFDRVSKAKHYNVHPSGVEVKEVTSFLAFNLGNCFKYVVRYDVEEQQNPGRSLKSALWYLREQKINRYDSPQTPQHKVAWVYSLIMKFAECESNPVRARVFEEIGNIVMHPLSAVAFEVCEARLLALIQEVTSASGA